MSQLASLTGETRGLIVQTVSNGFPVLWTYSPEMPPDEARQALPWLAVFTWLYDGSSRNGMPPVGANELMLMLEEVLACMERPAFCYEAYRRVGGGRREFVFYIADREEFMAEFNAGVAGHDEYPIKISFYEDRLWSELHELINDLGVA